MPAWRSPPRPGRRSSPSRPRADRGSGDPPAELRPYRLRGPRRSRRDRRGEPHPHLGSGRRLGGGLPGAQGRGGRADHGGGPGDRPVRRPRHGRRGRAGVSA
ncbi:hypothetical protein F8144_35270 [Streptomyces triticiradicis]|uniref:Uncharacterized protein n=1 Tax=Streptomyces triticiradicis TaxID=2651189 RepID=A0A7J5D874_9ACTN|nr:hypothetical protein F8144_35270 [Streptomyces triticiradicis]